MELDEELVIYALVLSAGRIRFKSSCSLAFLRIVESQAISFVEPLK